MGSNDVILNASTADNPESSLSEKEMFSGDEKNEEILNERDASSWEHFSKDSSIPDNSKMDKEVESFPTTNDDFAKTSLAEPESIPVTSTGDMTYKPEDSEPQQLSNEGISSMKLELTPESMKLPFGWEKVTDPTYGDYYWNREENITS